MSLIDSLKGFITPAVIGQISGLLGENNQGVQKAVDAGVPAILGGILNKASSNNGAADLFSTIQGGSFDASMLSNVAGLFGGGDSTNSLLQTGTALLGNLFGSTKQADGVAGLVSKAAGISQGSSSSLLGMLAPLAMSFIGSKVSSASGLTSLLAGEKDSIAKAAPAGLAGLLGLGSLGDLGKGLLGGAAGAASGAARGAANMAGNVATETAAAGGSMLRWLLPLLLVGVLGFIGWSMMKGCNTTAPIAGAVENTVNGATNAAGNAANAVGNAAGNAANAVTSAADTLKNAAGNAATGAAGAAGDALANLGNFFKRKLSTGVELNIPEKGIENNFITWVEDPAKVVDKDTWFNFDRLLFDTGKSTLKPESQEQLKNMSEILKAYPNVNIKLGGYTDNVGKPASNLTLSDARAKAVMAELVKMGIAADRVEAEGYGQEHPAADNATPEGRAQNRRIAVRVTKK